MKRNYICSAVALFCVSLGFAQNNRLELSDIINGKYIPADVPQMISTADGEYYLQLSDNAERIIKYSYKSGEAETVFDVKTARECSFKKIDGFELSPAENKLLIYTDRKKIYRRSFEADYWVYDMKRNLTEPLSEINEKQLCATFSPDGRMIAFVRKNNLYLKKLDYGTESAVTKDGEINKIINGIPDWVYEEEFFLNRAFEWSPDSKFISFIRFDESAVKEYSFPIYRTGQEYPGEYRYKYPMAGTDNSKGCVLVYSVETKALKKMDLPIDSTDYIPRIRFTGNPDQLAVITLNRSQNNLTMYYANPKSGLCKQILREESQTFVDPDYLDNIFFTPDQFVFVSEKDGYRHAYLYTINGVLIRQLTSGNGDITGVFGFNAETQTLYYESAEESPMNRAVYSIDIKGKKTKLSAQKGFNKAVFGKNFHYFVNTYSTLNTPPVISINDINGKTVRILETNSALQQLVSSPDLPKKEFITIPTGSGTTLNAWILKPSNFSASQKYPVLMTQYSGPDSQEVLDQFKFGWEYYPAANGYIVVCVDGEGTGARGEAFRKSGYMHLGIKESDSQIEAAKYLGSLSYIDKNRIGIWGWSFGGFNVLMSMSRSKGVFKAGISVAPVTDWRFYNTVFTERYMRTPKENFDGYEASSPIKLADRLDGNLLIIHGTADDNVHLQNTMNYSEALTQAGKQFDMQIYSDCNHSIYGGNTRLHLFTKMCDFLFKIL
ncbi:MAG: S9 family peptidase [Candidatus Azobacteroides sp.]|nr:S9 family peptidase [Candidatus Azobacteroides sp.]